MILPRPATVDLTPELLVWLQQAERDPKSVFEEMRPVCARGPHPHPHDDTESLYWLLAPYAGESAFLRAIMDRRRLAPDGPVLDIQGSVMGLLNETRRFVRIAVRNLQLSEADRDEVLSNPILMAEIVYEDRELRAEAAAVNLLHVEHIFQIDDKKKYDKPEITTFLGVLLFKAATCLHRVLPDSSEVDGLLNLLRRSHEVLGVERNWMPLLDRLPPATSESASVIVIDADAPLEQLPLELLPAPDSETESLGEWIPVTIASRPPKLARVESRPSDFDSRGGWLGVCDVPEFGSWRRLAETAAEGESIAGLWSGGGTWPGCFRMQTRRSDNSTPDCRNGCRLFCTLECMVTPTLSFPSCRASSSPRTMQGSVC